MGVLIVLNIILIVLLIFLSLYIFRNKKDDDKSVCVNDDKKYDVIEPIKYRPKRIKSERVFDGVFLTDDEYQQMKKNRRSDISILLEDVNKEYEHLKELINDGTERNNKR